MRQLGNEMKGELQYGCERCPSNCNRYDKTTSILLLLLSLNMVYFSFNNLVSQVEEATARRSERAKPHCSLCHQPMKGHRNVIDCPRNKQA